MKLKLIILMIILTIASGLLLGTNSNQASNNILGSDNKGLVIKNTYGHSDSGLKIAIITGMHPREISAKNVVPEVIKDYVNKHNVEIVNYQINVTDQPENFQIGRQNGESLVAKYVIPDIKKSNYNLVIICHNHVPGYGKGYYLATPTMDNKSISSAESIHSLLPDFNYYQQNVNKSPEQSSINAVDYPMVSTGTSVIVYEIPGLKGNDEVYNNTNRLFDSIFKIYN
ncbi:MAG: hypothetical protein ACPK7O_04120 [Methanobacterium sp.]